MKELAARAATLAKKSSREESLSGAKQIKDLVTLGLYQTVVYLGNAHSMKLLFFHSSVATLDFSLTQSRPLKMTAAR